MNREWFRSWKHRLLTLLSKERFGKFVSVGIIGAAFDTIVLVFLVEVVGLVEEAAVLLGIEAAILLMFVLNDSWTFADTGKADNGSVFQRLIKSHAVRSGGVTTQFVVFILIYRVFFIPLEIAGIDGWLLVGKASGIALGMLVNYTFETLFTWSAG